MLTFNDSTHDSDGLYHGEQSDVTFLGVPYDGMASGPGGQRSAPEAIRQASFWQASDLYDATRNTTQATEMYVDAGDVIPTPGDDKKTIDEIHEAAQEIMGNTRRLVTFGGDNSVSRHIIEGLTKVIDTPYLVLFDAHADIWTAEHPDHGTWVRDLIEADTITGASIFGTRGWIGNEHLVWAVQNNINIYSIHEDVDPLSLVKHVRRAAGRQSVYLAIDIDVLDPSCAPGTGFPEPGGFTTRELFGLVNATLDNFDVPAMDITEVLPAADPSGVTAKVANRLAVSSLFL